MRARLCDAWQVSETPDLARSFGAVAKAYDHGRPDYSPDAVRWLVGEHPTTVLELGAGTGKLTRTLVDLGHDFEDTIYGWAGTNPEYAQEITDWHDNWLQLATPVIAHSVRLMRALQRRDVPRRRHAVRQHRPVRGGAVLRRRLAHRPDRLTRRATGAGRRCCADADGDDSRS